VLAAARSNVVATIARVMESPFFNRQLEFLITLLMQRTCNHRNE